MKHGSTSAAPPCSRHRLSRQGRLCRPHRRRQGYAAGLSPVSTAWPLPHHRQAPHRPADGVHKPAPAGRAAPALPSSGSAHAAPCSGAIPRPATAARCAVLTRVAPLATVSVGFAGRSDRDGARNAAPLAPSQVWTAPTRKRADGVLLVLACAWTPCWGGQILPSLLAPLPPGFGGDRSAHPRRGERRACYCSNHERHQRRRPTASLVSAMATTTCRCWRQLQ